MIDNILNDNQKHEIEMMSPQKLAFVGDAIYELMIRNKIVCSLNGDIGALNDIKNKNVCCTAQSKLYEKIKDILTPEEIEIYKRGRNAHIGRTPRKVSPVLYRRATGVEALFGFLYLTFQNERLEELMSFLQL